MKILWFLLGAWLTLATGAYGEELRAERSAGCSKSVSSTGQFSLSATDGNKRRRTYVVQLPTDYDPARAYPVIFVFHAAGGDAAQAISWGLQSAPGAAHNAIFVFPNGIAYQNFGVGWDDTKNGYDLPFFDKMLENLASSYCTDRSRVFATGFSWGGDFVTTLICLRGAVLRGAQVNSATDEYAVASDPATYQNQPCVSPARPVTRFQHADGGDPQYPKPLFATTSRLFQQLSRCAGASTPVPAGTTGLACVSYSACMAAYSECVFPAALGHTLPPNWAVDTWAFFADL